MEQQSAHPIDLARLAEQTAGDQRLEREVLALFVDDAPRQVDLLKSGGPMERRAVAHRLLGAARAIGAGHVAREAAAVEAGQGDLAVLEAAVGEAVRFIAGYLSEGG